MRRVDQTTRLVNANVAESFVIPDQSLILRESQDLGMKRELRQPFIKRLGGRAEGHFWVEGQDAMAT